MKRLDINFSRHVNRRVWVDWCVLAIGVIAAVSVVLAHLQIDEALGELAYKVERLQHAQARAESAEPETPAEPKATLPDLAWLEMLDALGLQLGESVTLLSLQGERKSEQLELQCEAKDADAMFSFVARLEENRWFSDVVLRSHETVRDNPHKPVRFALTVQRKAQP